MIMAYGPFEMLFGLSSCWAVVQFLPLGGLWETLGKLQRPLDTEVTGFAGPLTCLKSPRTPLYEVFGLADVWGDYEISETGSV